MKCLSPSTESNMTSKWTLPIQAIAVMLSSWSFTAQADCADRYARMACGPNESVSCPVKYQDLSRCEAKEKEALIQQRNARDAADRQKKSKEYGAVESINSANRKLNPQFERSGGAGSVNKRDNSQSF